MAITSPGPSARKLCKDDIDAEPRARLNDCRSDEKPAFGVEVPNDALCGSIGELGRDGERGELGLTTDFTEFDVDEGVRVEDAIFFLDEKGDLNSDHSDSNCTDSSSDARGQCSSRAESIILSMRRSVTRTSNAVEE